MLGWLYQGRDFGEQIRFDRATQGKPQQSTEAEENRKVYEVLLENLCLAGICEVCIFTFNRISLHAIKAIRVF